MLSEVRFRILKYLDTLKLNKAQGQGKGKARPGHVQDQGRSILVWLWKKFISTYHQLWLLLFKKNYLEV